MQSSKKEVVISSWNKRTTSEIDRLKDSVVDAARLFTLFWREDATSTGRGLLLVERIDSLDSALSAHESSQEKKP